MKKLLLVLILLVSAGSLFAADLKITGDAMVRGNMDSFDVDATGGEKTTASYFDYDLNIFADLVVNENATVKTKLTYDRDVKGSGVVANSDANSTLAVERAYINYKFHPALQLNTGLMGGGQWASTFGDTEINVMRVQAIGALSADMVFIATYEKQSEAGNIDVKDSEKDDKTVGYLSSRMKFGPLTVLPLLVYGQKGVNNSGEYFDEAYRSQVQAAYSAAASKNADLTSEQIYSYIASKGTSIAIPSLTEDLVVAGLVGANKKYTLTTKVIDLGLNGDFGMVGFESEFIYKKVDTDGFAADHAAAAAAAKAADTTTMGAYLNVFAKVDPAKVGFAVAYGSSDDKDGSYAWGADFDFTQVVDDLYWGAEAGLAGFTAYKLYADVVVDKISGGIAGIYGAATDKDVIGDVSFWEVDLNAAYAFDANASYAVAFGYASVDDEGDTTTAWNLTHKFTVKF